MFTWKWWHYYSVKHILIKPNSEDVLAQPYKHGGVITFKIFFRGDDRREASIRPSLIQPDANNNKLLEIHFMQSNKMAFLWFYD